jgi:hypothetical protein
VWVMPRARQQGPTPSWQKHSSGSCDGHVTLTPGLKPSGHAPPCRPAAATPAEIIVASRTKASWRVSRSGGQRRRRAAMVLVGGVGGEVL